MARYVDHDAHGPFVPCPDSRAKRSTDGDIDLGACKSAYGRIDFDTDSFADSASYSCADVSTNCGADDETDWHAGG